jgi:ubiquinone/menaquinone biosynthesis C-methylase UbiE
MKILESAPDRYDTAIHILTLGRLDKAYDRLTSYVKNGQKVLDIGCGTGALTLRAALKGANVKGIDVNPQMLEIAQQRANRTSATQNVEFCEMGVAELDSETSGSYDVVMSGLCFSELTNDELIYTLKEVKRILKPMGMMLVADEVRPNSLFKRVFNWLTRFPLVIITYILVQTTTKAVDNIQEMTEKAGFLVKSVKLNRMETFMELIGTKPEE